MPQAFGVFVPDPALAGLLRSRCPERTFQTDRAAAAACRIAIVPADLPEAPGEAVVRIVLLDGEPVAPRRAGDVRVPRAAFEASPGEYLDLARDLAAAVMHAAQLELELGHLTRIQELVGMSDAEAVSERVTRGILDVLGLERGVLLLHDARLERYVVSFINDPDFRDTGDFLSGVPPDLLQRSLASANHCAFDRNRGLIIIPLQTGDDLLGVIRVPVPREAEVDETALGRHVRSVVQVLGSVYLQTRTHDLAMRDDLTKAFNRRFFETYLDEEIERSRRYGSLFTIIFLDLDDLKAVNNQHGHLTGSRTLQEVAKRILGAVRAIDKVVRFGGDEFCVILPQTDSDQAAAVANRIRTAIGSERFRIDPNVDVAITASFGIATYPMHAVSKEDLIRRADQAMYRVKCTTKNAVGIATVEDATRPREAGGGAQAGGRGAES